MSEESIKCKCDCCTKCILCGDGPRTQEDPWCPDCRGDMTKRLNKLDE